MTAVPFIARNVVGDTPTSTGLQSFTSPGLGTPAGALIVAVRCSSNGAQEAGWSISWGVVDGTSQRVSASWSADSASSGSSLSAGSNSACLELYDSATDTLIVQASFNAWVTDGVQLNFTTVDASQWRFFITLFGGTQALAAVFDVTPTTGGAGVTVGFGADFILTNTSFSLDDTQVSQSDCSFGIATPSANNSTTQPLSADGVSTSESDTIKSAVHLGQGLSLIAGTDLTGAQVSIGSYTSTGFSVFKSSILFAPRLIGLAVNTGGAVTVGTAQDASEASPTGAGSIVGYTWPAHKSGFLYVTFSNATTEATARGAAGGVGVTDFRNSACASVYAANGLSTSLTSSVFDELLMNCYNADQTVQDYISEFASQDVNGFSLSWASATGVSKRFSVLSIQEMPQNVTPTGIASAQAFGTPTLTPGAATVSPTGIASAQAFGTPTLTPGSVTISPPSITSAQAFGTPTLTAGAVTLSPTGIASAQAFGTPTLTPGSVTVTPTGIASAEAFGTPTVLAGSLTISPGAIGSAEAFGTPTLTVGAATLSPTGISSEEAFGDATLTPGSVTVSPSSIGSEEAFGAPELTAGALTISPDGIGSAEAFGTPTLTPGSVTVSPSSIDSEEAFGTPALDIVFSQIIYVEGIPSAEEFGITFLQGGFIPVTLKKKIFDRLTAESRLGTFIIATHDSEAGVLVQGLQVQPSSIEVNELTTQHIINKRRGLSFEQDYSAWKWLLILRFNEEVILEPFIRNIQINPLCIPREEGEDRQVLVLLTDATYEHPPREGASNGTVARIHFQAELSPR